MERITISIETELADAFDVLVDKHGYASRSEAIRDLVRGWLSQEALRAERSTYCVAQIGFVYSHRDRTLTERLAAIQHDHHDLVVSSMLLHLDHDHRLETIFVRGETRAVRTFADRLIAQRGVRHGTISIIPVEVSATGHSEAAGTTAEAQDPHGHAHARAQAHAHGQAHGHDHPHEHGQGDGPHLHLKPVA